MAEWAPGITISDVPLRKVVGRSSSVNNGWHRTGKNPSGFCGGESDGELEFMLYAEMDPGITVIWPQPTEIIFLHDGRPTRHIPDFAVIDRGESHLYEVKSRRQYDRADVRLRLRSAASAVEDRGWPYHVVLKQDILQDRRYPNVYDVWRRFRPTYDEIQRLAVKSTLVKGERTIADVLADLAQMGNPPKLETVLSLAANGQIYIDFDNEIGRGSIIRFADPAALPPPLLPLRHPADDLLEGEVA